MRERLADYIEELEGERSFEAAQVFDHLARAISNAADSERIQEGMCLSKAAQSAVKVMTLEAVIERLRQVPRSDALLRKE